MVLGAFAVVIVQLMPDDDGCACFELVGGKTSTATVHSTVEENSYFLSG